MAALHSAKSNSSTRRQTTGQNDGAKRERGGEGKAAEQERGVRTYLAGWSLRGARAEITFVGAPFFVGR